MISGNVNVEGLFKDTICYRVPLFQRYYVWNKLNWEHLWNDIEEKSEIRFKDEKSSKTHFTGAIVLQTEAQNLQEIIDGQQRLTTFQIILCVIRDICKTFRGVPEHIMEDIENCILNDPSRITDDGQKYKLLPREESDLKIFQFLVASEIDKAKKNDKSGFIHGAYDYFWKRIKNYVSEDYSKIYALCSTILQDFMVVQITLTSDDEYARIFESINGRGQHLDQFDLLRHDLFLRAGTGEERDRLYKDYWMLFEKAEEFWRNPGVADDFLSKFYQGKKENGFRWSTKFVR